MKTPEEIRDNASKVLEALNDPEIVKELERIEGGKPLLLREPYLTNLKRRAGKE